MSQFANPEIRALSESVNAVLQRLDALMSRIDLTGEAYKPVCSASKKCDEEVENHFIAENSGGEDEVLDSCKKHTTVTAKKSRKKITEDEAQSFREDKPTLKKRKRVKGGKNKSENKVASAENTKNLVRKNLKETKVVESVPSTDESSPSDDDSAMSDDGMSSKPVDAEDTPSSDGVTSDDVSEDGDDEDGISSVNDEVKNEEDSSSSSDGSLTDSDTEDEVEKECEPKILKRDPVPLTALAKAAKYKGMWLSNDPEQIPTLFIVEEDGEFTAHGNVDGMKKKPIYTKYSKGEDLPDLTPDQERWCQIHSIDY